MSNRGTRFMRNLNVCFQLSLMAMFSLATLAVAGAQTTVSSSTVAFNGVEVGTHSPVQTLTFKNTGGSTITVTSVTVTAGTPYAISPSSTCLTPSLPASHSCTVLLTFSPTALGAAPASTLTIDSTAAPGGVQTVTLSGTGEPATALAFPSINFGPVAVGESSSVWSEVLYNYEPTAIAISSIATAAPYHVNSTTCGSTLGSGAQCKIMVSLTPTALGTAPTGALTVTSNATNNPLSAPLNGKGVPPATLSVTSMNFLSVEVGSTSVTHFLEVFNWQPVALNFTSISTAPPYAVIGNNCGGSIPAWGFCTIQYNFTPTAVGAAPAGALTVVTNASNSPMTLTMNGTGVSPTTVSASTLAFGNVAVGSTSPIQSVTLTNWQSTALGINSITAPAPYSITANTCTSTLAAGAKCVITLDLTPTAAGAVPASALTITTNASDSPKTVTLTGTGIGPTSFSPTNINFGNSQVVGQTSAIRTVKLINNQSVPLSISSLTVTAGSPYKIDPSSTCLSLSVAAASSCTIAVTVTPATLYAQPPASVTVATNASNSPQSFPLSAYALPAVYLSPTSVHFGNGVVGTTSTPQLVTVYNYTSSTLSISSVVFNGPFVLDTGSETTCPVLGGVVTGPLPASQSCVFGVDFKPTVVGNTTGGQVTVIDSAATSPQSIPLYGTGVIAATVSPASLAFGNQILNTTSAAKTVTLTNYQTGALHLGSITVPAPYAVGPGSTGTPCVVGTPVASGASCTVNVTFSPTGAGASPATLTFADDAANSPQLVTITGTGEGAISLPSSLAFGNVVLNQMTTKSLTLVNNQATALTINSIAGFTGAYLLDATNTTCSTTTALAPGLSCVIAVDLTATTLGAQPAASFTVTDSAVSSPQTVTLTATAIQGVLLSPASLTFPTTFVGLPSLAKSVTMTNEQATAITINSATITGTNPNDFTVTTSCPTTPNTLSPSGHCAMNVVFTPTATGTRTATLTIVDTATGSPQTVTLTGIGNPTVVVSPDTTQTFTAPVGTTSAFKTFTITNEVPTTALIFTQFKLTGDFIQSATTCPIGGAGIGGTGSVASCTVSVEFNPSIGGTRDGQFQVYDTAYSSPQVVNLTGTGTSPLTLSLGSLSFTSQTVGTVSASKVITLTNHETEPETFSVAAVGSLAAADYSATTNCSTGVIAAQSSCMLYVSFSPTSITPSTTRGGTLSVTNSAPGGSTLTASLTGSAIATNPPAAVASVSPGAGGSGTVVAAVITGNGWTHFTSASTINFVETTNNAIACNIAVSGITSPNANTLDATLTLSGNIYGACDVVVTTPLSGGGTETAKLVSAFNLADPTLSHTITAVNPAFGTQGETLNVAITAVGTHFVQGTTIANFGDGVSMNSLTIVDGTDAVANITISNTTYVGYRTVTMQTNGEFAVSVLVNSNPIFQIGANNATLVTVAPNLEPQGFSGTVTLTATGTHFLENATTVSIGGVIVGDVNVTSPTVAVAQIAVPASAPIGPQNVTISTGGEITGLSNAFTITGATPALLTVVPSSGKQGQALNVVITGNAFTNFVAGSLTADFTGEITTGTIVVNNNHQVTVPITIHTDAVVGPITATLVSGTTNFPFTFVVTASGASITGVTPTCIPQGGQLNLNVTGLNTIWAQGTTLSQFYPAGVPTPAVDEVTINSATSATLAVAVPTNSPAGTYAFYLATGGQIVNATVNVCAATPTLTMSPGNGVLPTAPAVNSFTVNFTGQFTHWNASTLPVIAGEGVTLSNFAVTSAVSATGTVTIIGSTNGTPTATGARLVTFTTGGEIVSTYFNVTQTPVGIYYVNPWHTAPSTTLNVNITGLNTHFNQSTSVVQFGPQITVNSVTVTDATHLTANITTSYMLSGVLTPSPSGYQNIFINTGAEQVMGGFLVDYPTLPSIVSVSPSSGAQGATLSDVVITGNLTNWAQGTTEAILGAGVTVSNLTVTSPTSATATIAISPTAPIGGNSVVMITGSQVVSGSGFSVTPSAAYIQSVEPNFTCPTNFTAISVGFNCTPGNSPTGVPVVAQLQTVTLNLVGVGTHWLQGETAVSFGPYIVTDQLTVSSPTTAQVQITVLSAAPVGFTTLTTSTDGEVVSLTQAIDVEEGSPTLLAISPSSSEQGTSLTLQILGRFTHFNQATTNAAFNQDITVNSINVIDSENMTANITVSPLAYVDFGSPCGHDLTITTGNEQVTTGAITDNFCVAQGAEQINLVNPADGVQGSTETVTITGSSTNFVNGETLVSFGDSGITTGIVQVNSLTSLTVPVAISTSSTVGYHTVTVTTLGEVATQQFAFNVAPGVATLNEAIPNQAEQGAPLTGNPPLVVELIGQYSHFNSASTATFGAGITVLSYNFVSETEIDATISIDPLSYTGGRVVTVSSPNVPCSDQPNIQVRRALDRSRTEGKTKADVTYAGCTPGDPSGFGTEIVNNNVFTIIPGPAIISSVAPNTGNEGQEVVFNITGSGSHWAQNFTQFYIAGGGSDITINSVVINSPTSATVDMSISPTANPGARSVYMVTNGESLTDSGAFVVTGGVPVITYLSPGSQQNPSTGTQGLQVDIYGLYTNWATGTTVNFGPGITVESFQIDNATHIEAVINIAPGAQDGYRTVVVQTGPQGLTGNFQVTAPAPPPTPYVWYVTPNSALPGQTLTITINGAYTQWNPDTTVLEGFATGIVVNTFQVTSPTTARVNITIPANATASTSDLTLTTTGTTNNPSTEVDNFQFSVVIAQPTLSVVDPGSGLQGAVNLTVDILGQYTTFDSTTTFSFGPNVVVNGAPTILGPTIATQSISIPILAPLGGVSVVASTPDAAPIAQTVGGAGFSITPSLALIEAITPNTAAQGATPTVEVTGSNTHWDSATSFSFGDGIVVTSTVVNSATDATLTLAIPAYAGEGPTGATARTGGEVANINNGFVVTAGTPYLLSSGPGSVPQQGAAVFTILSQATTWTSANPPTVSYGAGVVLTNVNVTGPTSLTVDGYVQATTPVGYRNLTVSTGTQVLGINNAVYVSPGPAVVNSLSPNVGDQGVNLPAVQINGINTNWVQGTTTLTFIGGPVLINSFTVNSPTSITANITVNTTAQAGQYSVQTVTGGEVATGTNVFTVSQSEPELLAVVPNSGPQGLTSSPVNITGAFTHFVNGTTTANFGSGITVNSVTVSSATAAQANITVSPTTALGYRNVSVTTGTEVVNLSSAYNVIQGPAEIVGPLTPATGGEGSSYSIVVTGSQTHFTQNLTTASFGGGIEVTGVTVTSLTSATVNITIPNSVPTGSYNVVLTTGSEVATILGGFTVTTGSPQIVSVNPPTGTQGSSSLSVELTGGFTHWVNGTSTVSFGSGITGTLAVTDSTHATATINIGTTATIGSRNVTVTTGGEVSSITGGFSVLAGVPTLVSVSPSTIQAGTSNPSVTLTGAFTNFQQGFTTVDFGSGITITLVQVNSPTSITVSISAASNASVGNRNISVTTNSQNVTLDNSFSVTAGTPAITQINPNIGNPGQTLNVTIYGLYTNWVNGTTTANFGTGITVNSVTVSNSTTLTANISIGSSTPTGPVDVTTTTGGEVETVPGGFTIQAASIPAPSLLSISPGANGGGVPINTSFTFVFSQPMDRTTLTTSTVQFNLVSNQGQGFISVPGTVTTDASGRVTTFTPSNPLAVNSQYYLLLTNGIKDATENTFPQYGYVSFYTTDSANTTAPTVTAANPPASATNVGTNAIVELAFSADMEQSTQTGLVVSTGGNPVAGTWSWNSNPYGQGPGYGPGTLLYFTPTTAYSANTTYTVSYGTPLEDTAGNALTAGSFTFKTGAAPDSAQNYSTPTFENGQTNLATNYAPGLTYNKPVNPIDINSSTVLLYNGDSGKYVTGTVKVAANGLGATFTPTYPLLPDTYYYLHQSCGNYDMDGQYLNCGNWYFTTGSGSDLTAPTVLSISPANSATAVPLNAQITVHFNSAIAAASVTNAITVTPSGGSAIAGTASLSSDLVTLTFVPTSDLKAGTVFTVKVSGYQDMVGNAGAAFTSSFTTSASSLLLNVSTGLNASGNLITVNNTNDPHWTYVPVANLPGQGGLPLYLFSAGAFATGSSAPLSVVGPGDAGWYSGWFANGPTSDWIAINPNSVAGNTLGVYSTTFNIPGPTVPSNLCLVGFAGIDDNGELGLNGTAITGNINAIGSSTVLNIPISSALVVGANTLSLGWGSTDNSYEAFRLSGVIQTCGASFTGGLTVTGSTPANGTTGVATNTTVTLTFNNNLDPATVNANTLPLLITWNGTNQVGASYAVTGNQVVITPDEPLPINTQMWVGAVNGPYDTAGDAAAGGGYVQLINFTTGGTATAPGVPFQVTAFAPVSGATNVGLRAPVTATFNRSYSPGSINQNAANSDFALFAGDAQSPWCTSYSRSQDNTSLSFTCYPLPSSAVMTGFLNSSLTDWQGNPLTNFTSQFTTGQYDSNTNGSLVTSRPGSGATGIALSEPLTLYFNLPLDSSTANAGIEVAQNNVAVPGTVTVLDNGYTAVFTPSSNWTAGAFIQWWTTGSLIESTYNTTVNGASGYFYALATSGTTVPAVQVASPSQYSSGIPLNSIFDLQFNTPLNPATVTSTNVYLYDSSTSLNVPATISMPLPNEIRLTPSAALPVNHYIYVYLTTGLQSTTSVPLAATTNWYEYTGTTSDSTLPTIVSAVPYNGATGIGVNVAPGVVISKAIDPVSLNSSTFTVTNGGTPLAGSYWFNSGDTRIEFVPNAPLPASTNLVMKINGVLDIVGHPLTSTTSFTTGAGPDFQQPYVVSTSISSNETVPINSVLTVQFSESMDVTSFGVNNLAIYDNLQNVYIASTVTWNANQSIAYVAPTSPLAAGRQYTLYVNGGSDLAGNSMSNYSSGFYAAFASAGAAPTVTNFNPLSGATGLGTNVIVEAQFSAPIDPTTVSGVTLTTGGNPVTTSVSMGAANTVLELVPATPLAPNTTYKMTIAGVKDPAGNTVATVTNSFTTGTTYDINGPSATISDPAYNSTVGTNVTPKFVFNKALNPLTVNTSTFRMFLYDTGQQIPVTVTESSSGLEVTMQPLIALLPNTRYHFQACCGFQDQDGNDGAEVDEYFWTNGGTDSTAPTVTVSPLNLATGIPLNAQITATLSANIDSTSWTQSSIQVLKSGTPIAGTVTQPTNSELIFTPASALVASTPYTIKVSGFNDANGNAVAPSNTTFTTGTIAATGGLTLTSTSIVNGSNVTNNLMPITLTFSQTLNPGTVNLSTFLVMNSWNSNWGIAGTYVVNGNAVTFTPSNPYPPNATIYVGATGGLMDVAGDAYTGNPNSGWNQLVYFTTTGSTPDSTPLTVMSVSPAAGATNVRPDAPVSVTFNKGINPYSVYNNSNNALLFAGQGLQDRGSISMSPDNRTMTFNSGTLYTGTTYTIQLPAGGISDPSGNTLASTFSSTFVTGVNPATGNGSVQSEEPGNNATGVPTDSLLTLYMNRPVEASTLPGQLTVAINGVTNAGTVQLIASGYEIQFTPTSAFPAGATVQWFLSGSLLDVYGNAFYGTSGTFYTAATVNPATAVPTVIAVSPSYSSSSVPTNTEIDLEYSQPVTAASLTGNVYMYDNSNGTYPAVTITPASGSSTLVRLVPNSPLTPSNQYLVCTNSSVMGANGVAALSDCYATNFNPTTAVDTTPGTVTVGPPNSSTGVGTNAYIRLYFSKAVDITTINTTNIAITSGGNPILGSWSYNYTNNDVREVNFSPLAPLPASSTIKVATSGLLDYAGNTFTPVTTTFATAALPDYTQPTATLDFGSNTTGVATNASFTCLYSEPMDPASVNASNTDVYSYITNATIPVTYTWASDMMAVTMKPVTPLWANSEYNYACDGAIDLTGNGQQNNYSYFYTGNGPSSVGPVLVSANPPSGSTGVALNTINGPWNNTSLGLKFNEPVSTESMANITFTPQGGSPEPIAVYPQIGNTLAVVQLPYALQPNTQYTFNVAGVTDLNGNPATAATSSFTTGSGFDWTNPSVSVVSPANSTTGIAVNVTPTVTFSEAMNPTLFDTAHVYLQTHNSPVVVPATLALSTNGSGETVVTITPTASLAESTIYDVVVASPEGWYLYDIAGNYFPNNGIQATFTTGTASAVNGACGTANGMSLSSAPTANLCSAGTASAVTNPGSWTWTCNGNYGGTNASCSATVTGTPACSPQLASLVSLWPGNDNANDVGPGGNTGTLDNGVTYGLGEAGDAFSLSGANQYVFIAQPVPTNLQIQNAITLSAWIYPTALPTNYGSGALGLIVGSQHDGTTSGATIFFDGNTNSQGISGIPPGHIQFQIGNGSWHEYDTTTQLPLNQWTLITATRSANNPAHIYYNGVLQPSVTSESAWTGAVTYTGAWFALGQQSDYNRPFTGLIDDVGVYNAELTQSQISAVYNAGSGGVCQ